MAEASPEPPTYSSESEYQESYQNIYPPVERNDSIPFSREDDASSISIQEFHVSNIESQKAQLKENFDAIRNKLNAKEECMSELLEKKESDEAGNENQKNQLVSLYNTKSSLEESMKDPLIAATLAESLENIKGQITRLEKQLNIAKYLRWNMSECETAIENLCFVCECRDILDLHRRKRELLWENVALGSERTQVDKPVGLAIDLRTDHIFIADSGNKRIQVYNSQGGHLSQLALPAEKILFFSFLGEFLFIIELVGDRFYLWRLEPTSGKTIKKMIGKSDYSDFYTRPSRYSLFLIDMARNASLTLTICIYENHHKLWTNCLFTDTLDEVKRDREGAIELRSPHIKDFTVALDVKIVGSSFETTLFYVLYQNTTFALQVFNWSGEVVRSIIPLNLNNVLSLLLVDEENNLIICTVKRTVDSKLARDKQASEDFVQNLYSFYVYSDTGDRQNKWTYKSTNRPSMIQSIFVKSFKQRRQSTGAKSADNTSHAPIFGACLNSKQQLVLLHVPEHAFLLRAF